MRKILLFLFVVCLSQNIFSQKNKKEQEVQIVIHNVKLGETVRTISKKYLVEPSEIYKYNNFAVNGINEGMVLQIPVPIKEEVVKEETHEDVAYQSEEKPVVEIKKPVTEVKKAIEKPVVAPKSPQKQITTIEKTSEITHTVEPKETLYSLSKMYGVSVDEIKAANAKMLENGLQVGQVLKIKSSKILEKYESEPEPKVAVEDVLKPKTETNSVPYTQPVIDDSADKVVGNTIEHKVGPKETLYSLSKKYTNTIEEINQLNPEVAANGLKIGQVVKLNKK